MNFEFVDELSEIEVNSRIKNGTEAIYTKRDGDITEQKSLYKKVRESEESLRLVTESIGMYEWESELTNGSFKCSENAKKVFGFPFPRTLNEFFKTIHVEDREQVKNTLKNAIQNEWKFEFEYRLGNCPSNEEAWLYTAGVVLTDENDDPSRIVAVVRNITRRKQMKEDLQKSEERLRAAKSAARLGIYDYDVASRMLHLDKRTREFFGIGPVESIPYEMFLDALHPEERAGTHNALTEAQDPAGSGEYYWEHRVIGGTDGTERWIASTGHVFFENGKARRIVGVAQDITDRKQAEENLRKAKLDLEERVRERTHELVEKNRQLIAQGEVLKKSEELAYRQKTELESIYQSAPVGLCVIDTDFRYVHINDRFAVMTGIPVFDFVGRTPREVIPALAEQTESFLYQVLKTGEPVWNVEFNGTISSQPGVLRTWIGHCLPLRDSDGHISGINVVVEEITERKHAQQELENAYEKIKKLNEQLAAENIYLREKVESTDAMVDIIGNSNPLRYVMDRIKQVAQTDATVLLTGETGTGKGLFARALHEMSTRKGRPFVHVNCAGLPPNLIESELFGREKGAFTGSANRQIGRFELAQGGTIFLDEIGELPLELQAKLLKVIEDGELERLGSPHPIKVDVRIIASTNRKLQKEIEKGLFRMDLFYRLNVFPVTIPPLRQRKEDILLLAKSFTEKFSKKHGKNIKKISQNTIKALESYDWPGNVRELMHVIERAVIVSDSSMLHLAENIDVLSTGPLKEKILKGLKVPKIKGLVETERELILRSLRETRWKIEGPQGAAQLLGINPSTLRARMRKLGIKRPVLT